MKKILVVCIVFLLVIPGVFANEENEKEDTYGVRLLKYWGFLAGTILVITLTVGLIVLIFGY